jgi:NAD(P)-dependent dehydrogenase (short-subunit alcohol dehydrogenase family)
MGREGVLSIPPVWSPSSGLQLLKSLVFYIVDGLLMVDTASKGAVLALSRELAIVHAKDGIRVNALCPGPLNTPLLQNFLDTPEKRFRRTIHLPTGRFGILSIAKC